MVKLDKIPRSAKALILPTKLVLFPIQITLPESTARSAQPDTLPLKASEILATANDNEEDCPPIGCERKFTKCEPAFTIL